MSLLTSLVSYWKLDEASGSRADAHGSNTLTDNNTVGSGTGVIGTGADHDSASSETLSIATNSSVDCGNIDYSFSFWIKAETISSFPIIISKRTGTSGNTTDYIFYLDTGSSNKITAEIGSSGYGTIRGSTITTGSWFHIVIWHDSVNNQIGIAVNAGTPVTVSFSTGGNTCIDPFVIGKGGGGGYFNGLIDEVGFWKRVLTSQERTDLYNSGNGLAYSSFGGATFQSAWAIGSNVLVLAGGFLMKKNVAGQKIGAELVSATDGSAFTGSVTVAVTGDAGTQATGSVGSGACAHEGNGYHTYAPAQAETNYDLVAFTFTGTGAVPVTVQVFTSFPQTVDNATDISAVKAKTDSLTFTVAAVLDVNALRVGGTVQTARDLGLSVLLSPGTGTGQISISSGALTIGTNNDKNGYALTQGFPSNFSSLAVNASGHVVLQDESLTTAKLGVFALAKTTNITGFNDIVATSIVSGGALNTSGGALTGGVTLTAGERSSIATALLDLADGVELGVTMRAALRRIAASSAGECTGGGTEHMIFKAMGNTGTNRVEADTDEDGNRSNVTYG